MGCPWQECFDESTGYPYYWNVNTNAVTWEMPQEYKLVLSTNSIENTQLSTQIKPNISINKFLPTSSKILPIIPKPHIKDTQKRKPPPTTTRRLHRKSSESEDEKIELITSYGEESESDDENPTAKTTPNKRNIKVTLPVPKPTTVEIPKIPYGSAMIYRIQPEPQVIKPQKTPDTLVEMLDYNLKAPPPQQADIKALVNKFHRQNEIKKADDAIANDTDTLILNQLRKQAQILQELGGEVSQDVEKLIKPTMASASSAACCCSPTPQIDDIIAQIEKEQPPDLQKKELSAMSSSSKPFISLVAGYGDDDDSSDEDENGKDKNCEIPMETTQQIQPVKSLFPITESDVDTTALTVTLKNVGNVLETLQQLETDVPITESVKENSEPFENPSNTLLESTIPEEFDSKVFKRKRRIALDVLPTKIKKTEISNNFDTDLSSSSTPRIGFGFQQTTIECGTTTSTTTTSSTISSTPINPSTLSTTTSSAESNNKYSGGISFVKAETINLPKESHEKVLENIDGLDDMAALLREKVQFLEVGKDPITPIQVMSIQLDTLLEAHEKKGVTNQYLYDWLKETNTELSKLEQEAAPAGWCCQWDRLNKRYFYRNQQTGHIQWDYPADTDIVGGAEAMDICTTPPPPDDDLPEQQQPPQPPLPPAPTPAVIGPPLPATPPKSPLEVRVKSPKTPPPPQIREKSPSPPPPPRISATDDTGDLNIDRVSTSPTGNISQPLPPGIDSPSEVTFAVSELSKNGLHKNNTEPNTSLGSELESFYSDIASLDAATNSTPSTTETHETNVINNVETRPIVQVIDSVVPVQDKLTLTTHEVKKKKKKTKLGSGLTLKKKEVSLLVEKWKKVQNDF